jgi:O-antigen ligase
MIDRIIKLTLILLLIFTPVAFGAMDFWAFSLMELGILFVVVLWAIQFGISSKLRTPNGNPTFIPQSAIRILQWVLLGLFLCLVLFQVLPLPPGMIKTLSPKAYELRHTLLGDFSLQLPASSPQPFYPLSLVPFATQIEFFKWLTLIGLFLFLQYWDLEGRKGRGMNHFLFVIFTMGVLESLYGMMEVFSGHNQALNVRLAGSPVAGTFISPNYFSGYLLMVIPLGIGFLLSREEFQVFRLRGWRNWLPSLHGKTVLIGFGAIVMILGLLFSASRMGVTSLLFSFSLLMVVLRRGDGGRKMSGVPLLILALALLWAVWIGLDATINRFFTVTEDFESRWAMWVNTFRIIKDFPLLGSGLGTFTQIFPMYRTYHTIALATHAENDFLQLTSEVGLAGTGILLILFLSFFYKGLSGIRSMSRRDPGRYVGMGSLVGILALMFHSLVEANIQIPANAFLFTFIFGLLLRLPDISHKKWSHEQDATSTH